MARYVYPQDQKRPSVIRILLHTEFTRPGMSILCLATKVNGDWKNRRVECRIVADIDKFGDRDLACWNDYSAEDSIHQILVEKYDQDSAETMVKMIKKAAFYLKMQLAPKLHIIAD
jgi:hypothetical protein